MSKDILSKIMYEHPVVDNYFTNTEKIINQAAMFQLKFKEDFKIDFHYLTKLANEYLDSKCLVSYKKINLDMVRERTIYRIASNHFRHNLIIDNATKQIFYDNFLDKINPVIDQENKIHKFGDKLDQSNRYYVNSNLVVSHVIKNKIYQELNNIFSVAIQKGNKSKEMHLFSDLYKQRKGFIEKFRKELKTINSLNDINKNQGVLITLANSIQKSTIELEKLTNNGLDNIAKNNRDILMLTNLNIQEGYRMLQKYIGDDIEINNELIKQLKENEYHLTGVDFINKNNLESKVILPTKNNSKQDVNFGM